MNESLPIDRELVDKERNQLKLPKPTEFKDGRIEPDIIDKLLPLLAIPFDESAIETDNKTGFKSKGVHYALQLNRLQEVFGASHVFIEHVVKESDVVSNLEKNDMYYYKVYVTISIGNWTTYSNAAECRPDSSFVTHYKMTGIGFAGAVNKGTAEKNAWANGLKDVLSKMGMLRYLYLDESDDTDDIPQVKRTTVILQENISLLPSGAIFARCKAIDTKDDSEHECIIFREVKSNDSKDHQKMLDDIRQHVKGLVKDKTLEIEYVDKDFKGKSQYIINKILYKQNDTKS